MTQSKSKRVTPRWRFIVTYFLLTVGCWLLAGCETAVPPAPVSLSAPPATFTPAPPLSNPTAAPTPLPDTGWQPLRPGLERRIITLNDDNERPFESLYLLRLEPEQFRFEIAYQPGAPKGLLEWQAETGALVVVNGGFFTETHEATGLIIVNGQASGISYIDLVGCWPLLKPGQKFVG